MEGDTRRIAKEAKSVQKYLGPIRHNTLLRISRVATEAGIAPIWMQLANSNSKEHLGILQSAINQEIMHEKDIHLEFVVSSSLLAVVLKISWYLTSKDAIETGF